MNRSRLELEPGVTLDARHAVWLGETRTLVVADLHFGYAWAHRASGQMLPLSAEDTTRARLLALIEDYAPAELVLLGDIVHRAIRVKPFMDQLGSLLTDLGSRATLRIVLGNHDRQLASLLAELAVTSMISLEHLAGVHLLQHGDCEDISHAAQLLAARQAGRVIIGHEHPAITVSDGVANRARCPCFLVAPRLLVLPAFSTWSAGTDVRNQNFLSAYTRCARAERAIAVIAGRLLPLRL